MPESARRNTGVFAPFEWMIAARYLRAKRRESFISVISLFSLIGIALGVATLIIVMSVMNGFKVELLESSPGEEAGIKSMTFRVTAPYAYGTLSVEQGTHRLVRISPFDSQSRRHTSFCGVEVVPVVDQSDHIEIDEKEIRVDVYRSSGPGGQGVNTTDSAVRITHMPTGIVVSCQNERSQIQNKATAMAVLQSKLLERRRQEEQAKINALKGDSGGSWGNQMRSYVLAPYQMVKDLRNNHETGNTSAVLNGEIDDFIEAGIRWRRSSS